MKRITIVLGFLIILFAASFLLIQNKAGISPSSLPQNTQISQPEQTIRESVEVLATNLDIPWSLAFLPDGSALFTERSGRIRELDKSGKVTSLNIQIPEVKHVGEGGLLGIAVDPDFENNKNIYVYYTFSENNGNTLNRVVRFTFDGNNISDEKILISRIPGGTNHNGGRLKFGPDGNLYVTTGDSGNPSLSQNKDSLAGKILRVDREDNVRVFSLGHRNPQGLDWNSVGRLYSTEHGPSMHDEINLIEQGANFGWPTIQGTQQQSGMVAPILESGFDTWAPSGAVFYKDRFFFAGLRGTALFEFNPNDKSLTRHFDGEFGRIRDVVLAPDNLLYILTNNTDGRGSPGPEDDRIIRVNPESL